MRIALIADVFPPQRSSGAVQLRDLSVELVKQGHNVTMMVSAPELDVPFRIEDWCGICVVRLKTPKTKDLGYVRRTINEFVMPFAMLRNLRKSSISVACWDGVAWYSPTIFLGPLAHAIKRASACRSYLIIRDIFPEWAADMGLMGKGLPYRMFKAIASYQYAVADVIGVQTQGNCTYFTDWLKGPNRRVDVLQNWLADAPDVGCSITLADGKLAGRTIFVYAGNMGVAQGMGILLELADRLRSKKDIGFLFVGRGSDSQRLKIDASKRGLDNVDFFDEIDPNEIPGLYAQCHVGLVALDPRHKTHNIPGKFLSYMQSGLPVLASINPGNDLVQLIERERVGHVCTNASVEVLGRLATELINDLNYAGHDLRARCKALAARMFSPEVAAKQIVTALHE
jgi:glycosyltransferase involved in cell wall biosynthesis